MKSHSLILVSLAILQSVSGGNILFLSGIPSPSHHIFNRVLAVGLTEKGHNVTFLSADLPKKTIPNLHYIHLEKVYEVFLGGGEAMDILHYADRGTVESILGLRGVISASCTGILASKGLDVILNYPSDFKFDVVIYDFTFGPCLLPLLTKFNNPPLVSISAFANPPYSTDLVGGQKYPAYVPHYAINYSSHMTFFQRCFNTYLYFVDWLSREFDIYSSMEQKTRERFKFEHPSLTELAKRTSLIMINTDNAIDFPEPLQPNMIQIGGLQIVDPKPLPAEMDKFIASGKKGTVLMSLGTNMKSNQLGEETLINIIKTFAEIPDYNFLWKFESEVKDLPHLPSANLMVSKWLPQNDILAHPNLKAFVSHGGMLSTHEALWHGKPIIGMPFFVDQHRNLGKAIRIGVANTVDFRNLQVEEFKRNILEILDDKSYYENAQKVSKLFKDKPERPLAVALWWIEYAMRNPNLDNLRSPTLDLGPFASKSFDVLIFLVISLHAIVFILIRTIKFILKSIKGKSKSKRE